MFLSFSLALVSGFGLGFAGVFHCLGMCSPLAYVVKNKFGASKSLALYHLGRATSYLSLGVIGASIGILGNWANQLQLFSVMAGVLLLLSLVLPNKMKIHFQALINRFTHRNRGPFAIYFFGIANGLLPCGLVYAALAATIAFGNLGQSLVFMVGFSLATIPAFSFGQWLLEKLPFQIKKTHISFALGVFLIIRGLGLGIPYLSPSKITEQPIGTNSSVHDCR